MKKYKKYITPCITCIAVGTPMLIGINGSTNDTEALAKPQTNNDWNDENETPFESSITAADGKENVVANTELKNIDW